MRQEVSADGTRPDPDTGPDCLFPHVDRDRRIMPDERSYLVSRCVQARISILHAHVPAAMRLSGSVGTRFWLPPAEPLPYRSVATPASPGTAGYPCRGLLQTWSLRAVGGGCTHEAHTAIGQPGRRVGTAGAHHPFPASHKKIQTVVCSAACTTTSLSPVTRSDLAWHHSTSIASSRYMPGSSISNAASPVASVSVVR
jgi:hypothetical protein